MEHGQEMTAQNACTTAAARTSAVGVLRVTVEDHSTAVSVLYRNVDILPCQNVDNKLAADRTQISRDYQVIVVWAKFSLR